MASEKKYRTLIVWFRRNLRVTDNASLAQACLAAERVIPLFILDPDILSQSGAAQVEFLLDALGVLDRNLRKRGGRLIVRRGRSQDEIIRAAQEYEAEGVFHHREYEPWGCKRDAEVAAALHTDGKTVETFSDVALFEPDQIKSQSGAAYTVFGPYKRVWFSLPVDAPCPAPAQIIVPDGIQGEAIPSASELILPSGQTFECGGEDAALTLLQEFLTHKAGDYEAQRDILGASGTSRLSRHLHLGTIGPRTVVDAVRRGGNHAETFLSEIAWRDFYGQILHFFPHVTQGAFHTQFDALEWQNDEALFAAWKEGRTGYPIVDAAMRQMNAEAWMHNRGRMVTASFLTKDLLVDWRWGERYFMEKLVDGDQAANNGGWQWAAGTGTDAQPFFRIFNPTTQGEKFDPEGVYVRRWIPELSRVPLKVIHTPWKLSNAERQQLGCDAYPPPVVDHTVQRSRALAMYEKVSKARS